MIFHNTGRRAAGDGFLFTFLEWTDVKGLAGGGFACPFENPPPFVEEERGPAPADTAQRAALEARLAASKSSHERTLLRMQLNDPVLLVREHTPFNVVWSLPHSLSFLASCSRPQCCRPSQDIGRFPTSSDDRSLLDRLFSDYGRTETMWIAFNTFNAMLDLTDPDDPAFDLRMAVQLGAHAFLLDDRGLLQFSVEGPQGHGPVESIPEEVFAEARRMAAHNHPDGWVGRLAGLGWTECAV
jgi:hypothetical protein